MHTDSKRGGEILLEEGQQSIHIIRRCHDMLFLLLIERGLPPVILRSLFDSYKRSRMRTVWNGSVSVSSHIVNGIRQGSVISPVLFTVYMDELLQQLERSGVGCCIGAHYYGAAGSADDLTLMCPTPYGLQKMMDICESFGKTHGMKYNPTKMVKYNPTKTSEPRAHSAHWIRPAEPSASSNRHLNTF